MDQLATTAEGKKCKLTSSCSTVSLNSTAGSGCTAGDFDFIECEKCGLSIHKNCFKLCEDLLKIFQEYEKRKEKFPLTILCSECRQFFHDPFDKAVDGYAENKNKLKNPFENDSIVKVLLEHLNIQDLVNIRLVNKLFNQTASAILSLESRQVQLEPYDLNGPNKDLEKCLQIVKSSKEKKLFQNLMFDLNVDLKTSYCVYNEMVKITKPTSVLIYNISFIINKVNQLLSNMRILTNISDNIVDLLVTFKFSQEKYLFSPTNFSLPKYSKLKSLTVYDLLPEYAEFIKMIIDNSAKLTNFTLHSSDNKISRNFSMDNFINDKSKYCLLSEKSAQNLQQLELYETCCNFGSICFQMKLKTLSLVKIDPHNLNLSVKLRKFLTNQNDTLENLKISIYIPYFIRLDYFKKYKNDEEVYIVQMDLSRLDNVQHFQLGFKFSGETDDQDKLCNPDEKIWPVKPINLTEKFPNLKKITIKYCQSWALSFETGENCHHSGVTELVLTKWTDGDLTKLVELFPRVEILNLKKFSYSEYGNVKIYTKLENLNGWSKSLKRIEISCDEYSHLDNFDFENFVCLTNLESIKICKINGTEDANFIFPDFTPLFKIATLSQVAIKNFKISRGIVENLREKYPSLDYSFYSTCKSTECTSADFVNCQKCGLSIYKNYFKLSGDLLKIFQDFETRNEKFPFTILCSECRQFFHKSMDNVNVVVDSCEDKLNLKNPFEIDCIVQVIMEHLNIQDLVNVRLLNKLWNQNVCRILSKESRQVHLEAYSVKGSNSDLEKCLQIVKNSEHKEKMFQNWEFNLDKCDLNLVNEIVTITKPTDVSLSLFTGELDYTLFSTLMIKISENIVDLKLDFDEMDHNSQAQFCIPKFSKLKSLTARCISSENCEYLKMIISNSPKLINFSQDSCGGDDVTLDDFFNDKSIHCLWSGQSAQKLKSLKIWDTLLNFESVFFQMKLNTLSLQCLFHEDLNFAQLKKFLTSQNDSLENLKIYFTVGDVVLLEEVEDLDDGGQIDLPRMDNVQHFLLAFHIEEGDRVWNTEEIWPLKPIQLSEKFPNLKKVTIKYCQSWALSFETGENCHNSGVSELVLTKWTAGDLTKLVELFPRVETLNLKKFSYSNNVHEKVYTKLENLNGWSESLKRIEISCEYYHLESFDFESLVCLSNLQSINISKTKTIGKGSDVISSHFIYPDFTPLFKISTLSQVVIKNFKISRGITQDLREKYPSLDYSFYPIFINNENRQ